MIRKTSTLCGAALLLAIAACDNSTAPSNVLSQADANELAADMDAVATLGAADVGMGPSFSLRADAGSAAISATPLAINNQFTVTKQCPRGGQVVIDGTTTGSADAVTRSLSLELVATRTDTNCGFQTKNGTLTLNGNPNIAYDGKLNIVNAALSGLQTQTHKGSFTWARDGGSGTCDVDIASSFDPTTHTVTVTGTFCGIAVDVTRSRTN
jgi:hypothetical protein